MTGSIPRTGSVALLIILAACSSSPSREPARISTEPSYPILKAGKLYERLPCKKDAFVTYALYMPSGWKEGQKLPLFLAFDPDASGMLPVKKYKSLADRYNFILAGSNNSKNNQQPEETARITGALTDEILTRLPADSTKVFVTGFSGGSRIAGMVCMLLPWIKGMIGCGAGFAGNQEPVRKDFSYFGIVGDADFNLQEMIGLSDNLDKANLDHQLVIFTGKHEWPPEEIFELGVIWNLKGGRDPQYKEDLASLKKAGKIRNPSSFGKAIRDKELAAQEKFASSFYVKDIGWWKTEIEKMRNEKGLSRDEIAMNQRLLSYISLLCYYQSKKALDSQARDAAGYCITLYELADPENPEVARMKEQLAGMP